MAEDSHRILGDLISKCSPTCSLCWRMLQRVPALKEIFKTGKKKKSHCKFNHFPWSCTWHAATSCDGPFSTAVFSNNNHHSRHLHFSFLFIPLITGNPQILILHFAVWKKFTQKRAARFYLSGYKDVRRVHRVFLKITACLCNIWCSI